MLRTRSLLPVLAALALLLGAPAVAAACPGAHVRAPAASPQQTADSIRCLVDWVRSANGVHGLREAASLRRAARRQLRTMMRSHRFGHTAGFGRRLRAAGFRGRAAGENLATASGRLATPLNVVLGWWRSPAHRANMLDRRWRSVGVTVARYTPSGRRGVTAVAVFGG